MIHSQQGITSIDLVMTLLVIVIRMIKAVDEDVEKVTKARARANSSRHEDAIDQSRFIGSHLYHLV